MNVGKSIRFHRTKMCLTQEELATGLISVSYLSKIENGQINASPDIIEELLNRLNITDAIPQNQKLCEDIRCWYQQIIHRDKQESVDTFNRLSKEVTFESSFEPHSLFQLISVRYFLTLGKLDEARHLLRQLSEIEKDFSKEMSFYYYKFKGNFEYMNNEFESAFDSYKEAEGLIEANTPSLEKADVFYSIALTATKLEKHVLAVLFTNQALEIFREIYNLDRSSECHLLLGILYQRLEELDEAETHFKWAENLAKKVSNKAALGVIEHNLGYFYYLRGDQAKSLNHYKKSLDLKQEDNYDGRLTTILFILKALYKTKDTSQSLFWLEAGKESARKTQNPELKHQYTIFMHLHKKEFEEFEYHTKKMALPYFIKNRMYRNASYYSEILAEYYKENRKYKQSSKYFEYCKDMLKKIYK